MIAPSQTHAGIFAHLKNSLKYDNFAVGGCQFLDWPQTQGARKLKLRVM
jgi:hypothetical protein